MARGMAAGEEAKTLRIHGALRSSRTSGEVSDPIVGERPLQVKSDPGPGPGLTVAARRVAMASADGRLTEGPQVGILRDPQDLPDR